MWYLSNKMQPSVSATRPHASLFRGDYWMSAYWTKQTRGGINNSQENIYKHTQKKANNIETSVTRISTHKTKVLTLHELHRALQDFCALVKFAPPKFGPDTQKCILHWRQPHTEIWDTASTISVTQHGQKNLIQIFSVELFQNYTSTTSVDWLVTCVPFSQSGRCTMNFSIHNEPTQSIQLIKYLQAWQPRTHDALSRKKCRK